MVVSRKIGSAVLCLAWDKGSTLYAGCEAGDVYRLRLGETEEGDVEKLSVPGHHTSVHSLAVRGNFVVIGSRNIVFWKTNICAVGQSTMFIWDRRTKQWIKTQVNVLILVFPPLLDP